MKGAERVAAGNEPTAVSDGIRKANEWQWSKFREVNNEQRISGTTTGRQTTSEAKPTPGTATGKYVGNFTAIVQVCD